MPLCPALAFLCFSCAALAPYESASDIEGGLAQPGRHVAAGERSGPDAVPVTAQGTAARQIVYTGHIRISVASTEAAAEAAARLAAELGGWVQELTGHRVLLRIPADQWQSALLRVAELGRVLDRRIQASDVTEQVVDLRVRLKNAVALRDRLAQLLEKADTVAEALQIETELARVRTEIEQLEGRLQLLERQVAFCTLTLDLVQAAAAPRAAALPFDWLTQLGLPSLLGGRP